MPSFLHMAAANRKSSHIVDGYNLGYTWPYYAFLLETAIVSSIIQFLWLLDAFAMS